MNARACQLVERVPSCDKGLRENLKGVCVKLKPGEFPILATLADLTGTVAKIGKKACHEIIIKSPVSISPPISAAALLGRDERRYFNAGLYCAVVDELDVAGLANQYASAANQQFQKQPCASLPLPMRPRCAVMLGAFKISTKPAACLVAGLA